MSVQNYLLYVVTPIIALAFIIIIVRFLKGPRMYDRIVAMDLLITSGLGLIGVFSIYFNDSVFLDVATVMAVIGFLSTIAFAYYLDKEDIKRK
jgi:multicomponent Na+:H+ antiporter subunit F